MTRRDRGDLIYGVSASTLILAFLVIMIFSR
jgi:hypothetical protein